MKSLDTKLAEIKKDRSARAFILADALRTDGHRLRPLQPDSEATLALRATVRARKDLVHRRGFAIEGVGVGLIRANRGW